MSARWSTASSHAPVRAPCIERAHDGSATVPPPGPDTDRAIPKSVISLFVFVQQDIRRA